MGYLTDVPGANDTVGPFSFIYLVFFAVGFLVSCYYYYRPWQPPVGRLFRRKSVRKATTIAMWVFGAGLFFLGVRLLQVNPFGFGMRLWMYLCFLAAAIMLAVFAWEARKALTGPRLDYGSPRDRVAAYRRQPPRRPVKRRRV